MSRGRPLLPLLCAGLLLAAPAVAAPAAGDAGHARRLRRVVEDSLLFARSLPRTDLDSLHAVLRVDLAAARRASDHEVLARLLRFQGIALAMGGDAAGAIAPLEEGQRLAEAQRDSAILMVYLRWRAYVAGVQGQFADQERMAKRLVLIAERRRDTRYQAIGHNFLGWIEHRLGDHRRALFHLERAVQQHRANHSLSDEAVALTALGSTQMALGQYDAARATYEREIAIARELGQAWSEAEALNDLGILETQIGDPARAAAHLRRAYAMHRRIGETIDAVEALANLAGIEVMLGRQAEAVRLIREGIAICERRGFALPLGGLFSALAEAEESRGRPAAADSARQRIFDQPGEPDAGAYVGAAIGRADVLERSGRTGEALEFLQRARMRLGARTTRLHEVSLDAHEAELLLENGRANDAAMLARRSALEAETIGFLEHAVSGWRTVARAEAAAGHATDAGLAYERALEAWEAHRRKPTEPEWRERRGSQGAALGVDYVSLLLAEPSDVPRPQRIAKAFELVQRVKTRTLIERMSGPHAFAPDDSSRFVPVGLRAIQDSVLRKDELLVEWLVAENGAYRFAVSRAGASVDSAPGLRELQAQIQAVRGGLATRPQADVAADPAALAALAERMWPGLGAQRAGARRIIVAPDGPVHLVPFAALDGASAGGVSYALVPSATVLADIRRRAPAASRARGLLACAPTGTGLAGAQGEVAWLARQFQDVVTVSSDTLELADLALRQALHLAGHSRVDDHYPWRSAIGGLDSEPAPATDSLVVGSDSTRAGRRGPLRAEDIAGAHVDAGLVVLSSCATAGGRVVTGEGVAGLATAFLAAGAPTVLATLWPVDDRTTEQFMREFYRGLGAGHSAGDALVLAQAAFRRDPALRHPFYWAGYVILGDGDTRLPLRSKSANFVWWAGLAGAMLVAGSWLLGRRRAPGAA